MGPIAAPEPGSNEFVTLVIRHLVKAPHAQDYEAWLKRIIPVAQGFPGHLGVNVIRPTSDGGTYTIILRFDNAGHLEAWVNSAQRRALLAEVAPVLQAPDHLEVTSGSSFWFTPEVPGVRQPARWKQALLTLLIIYPLTKLVPALWHPVFEQFPALSRPFVGDLLVTATLVALVVYLIMPRATRLLAAWLTPAR